VGAQRRSEGKTFVLRGVADFTASQVSLIPDIRIERVEEKEY
jgi:hypothetical protein